jgi:hypothetical protein
MATQCTLPTSPARKAAPKVIKSMGTSALVAWWNGLYCFDGHALRRGLTTLGPQVIIDQDVQRRRIKILILAAAHGPHECPDGGTQQDQTQGYQQQQNIHRDGSARVVAAEGVRVRRKALSVTANEDKAMPKAASHGVTHPAAANGRAKTL